MKVTLDTNFLISATQWDYSVSRKLLIKLINNNVEMYTTEDILSEFSNVLLRDFNYKNEEIEEIITTVIGFVKVIETSSEIAYIKDDPEDNKILACAVDSSSEYIITYDKHLLNIKTYQGIRVITPEEASKIFT